jgi:hypothetical protein
MRWPRCLALIVTTLAASSSAHADDDAPKDRTTALRYSITGTVVSGLVFAWGWKSGSGGVAALGAVSSLITPSFGEWYAGQYLTTGMLIRLGATALAVEGLAHTCIDCGASTGGPDIVVGVIGYAAGIAWDIAFAPAAADAYNAAHGGHATVAPTVVRTPAGAPALGLGICGTF